MAVALAPARICRTPTGTLVFAIGDLSDRPRTFAMVLRDLARRVRAAASEGLSCVVVAFGGFARPGFAENLLAFETASGCVLRPVLAPADAAAYAVLEGADDAQILDLATAWLARRAPSGEVPAGASLRDQIAAATTSATRELLRRGVRHLTVGDYAFVYDRLDPYRPLPLEDLLAMLRERNVEGAPSGPWPGVGLTGHTVTAERIIQSYDPASPDDPTGVLLLSGPRYEYIWSPSDDAAGPDQATLSSDTRAAPVRRRRAKAAAAPMALGVAALVGALAATFAVYQRPSPQGADRPAQRPAASPAAVPDKALHAAVLQVSPQTPLPAPAAAPPALRPQQSLTAEAPELAIAETRPEPDAPTATAPVPPDGPPSTGRTLVQIAAVADVAEAEARWAELAAAFPEGAAGRRLETWPVRTGGRRLQRALVAGFASPEEARDFCETLKQGGRDCLLRYSRR